MERQRSDYDAIQKEYGMDDIGEEYIVPKRTTCKTFLFLFQVFVFSQTIKLLLLIMLSKLS